MKNPVGYFEIPVNDLDRATRFYEVVFGYQIERAQIDGLEMGLFPSAHQTQGITGALVKGDTYVPAKEGSRLYFSTDNIDQTLDKVLSLGGACYIPKHLLETLAGLQNLKTLKVIALHYIVNHEWSLR